MNYEQMMDPVNMVSVLPNNNYSYEFKQEGVRAMDYDQEEKIYEELGHLRGINGKQSLEVSKPSVYFIMRSTNDDDLHKAIKYQVWCSSPKNNQILSQQFQESLKHGQPVYLIFSVVKSYQFCGVAQLVSDLLPHQSYRFWWEDNKYFGSFKLKWLFIKDINDISVKVPVLVNLKDVDDPVALS